MIINNNKFKYKLYNIQSIIFVLINEKTNTILRERTSAADILSETVSADNPLWWTTEQQLTNLLIQFTNFSASRKTYLADRWKEDDVQSLESGEEKWCNRGRYNKDEHSEVKKVESAVAIAKNTQTRNLQLCWVL